MLVLFLAVGMILGGCQNTQEKPQTGKGEETSRDETEDTPEEEKNYDVKLSKNLYDFEFAINDTVFHLPQALDDWKETGWSYERAESEEMLDGDSFLEGETLKNEEKELIVDIVNLDGEKQQLGACSVGGVTLENTDKDNMVYQLPGKITVGESTLDDVLDAYGDPDDQYEEKEFLYQIIDEAQYIKNPSTQAAKGVKKITAAFKLALTGTPIENRLSELWSIFDYLMPGFLYTYQKFREEIETPIVVNKDENKMERLQRMIRPFILRRLKGDVLKDLPEKLEENVYAKMEGEQLALYDAHVQQMKQMLDGKSEAEFKSNKIQILAELTKLRQLCCDPALLFEDYKGESAKVQMCMDLIGNAVHGGHKVLLFSQFTTMLDRLAEQLKKLGIDYYMLTGSVNKEKRMQMVDSFNKDDVPVFCISLKAGGTGLNLTAADIVIHYDPWWNVAVQNQATDRAHRIGQKNVVTVYKLVSQGTIEEKIIDIQEKKKKLAEQVLEGEGMDSVVFTKEEIMELLG